jgi:integrase
MSADLRQIAREYLAVRRSLGFRLERAGRLLGQFLDHLDATGQTRISSEAALAWASLPGGGPGSNWAGQRLSVVRGLARWAHSHDPGHELIAPDLLPTRVRRANPYLYSPEDVAALIAATQTLRTPLRRATYATLVGLLSVTGMRLSEVINLDRADIDPQAGTLLIRNTKFGKTRQVITHPSTLAALTDYQRLRDLTCPATATPALLVSTAGTRLLPGNVRWTFRRLVGVAGLEPRGTARPRIHDLRHSFAVNAMRDAYANGQDGQSRMALICTWLGHVHPKDTYWYLSASPDLMALAGDRLEQALGGRA